MRNAGCPAKGTSFSLRNNSRALAASAVITASDGQGTFLSESGFAPASVDFQFVMLPLPAFAGGEFRIRTASTLPPELVQETASRFRTRRRPRGICREWLL